MVFKKRINTKFKKETNENLFDYKGAGWDSALTISTTPSNLHKMKNDKNAYNSNESSHNNFIYVP